MIMLGGNSETLFAGGIQRWKESLSSNLKIIQFQGIKPMYSLLDEDQRSQVMEIYSGKFMEDNYIFYNYPLEFGSNGPDDNQYDWHMCEYQYTKTCKDAEKEPDCKTGEYRLLAVCLLWLSYLFNLGNVVCLIDHKKITKDLYEDRVHSVIFSLMNKYGHRNYDRVKYGDTVYVRLWHPSFDCIAEKTVKKFLSVFPSILSKDHQKSGDISVPEKEYVPVTANELSSTLIQEW